MARLRFLGFLLTVIVATCTLASASGAALQQAEAQLRGGGNAVIVPANPFGTFANAAGDGDLPDCQYAAAANLELAEYPSSIVTTAAVVAAYYAYGTGWIAPYWAGQWYLVNVGFDGHRASAVTQIDESQVEAAANAGGVEVELWESALGGTPGVAHDVAIVSASATTLEFVNSWDGYAQSYTWAAWDASIAPSVITYSAVTW